MFIFILHLSIPGDTVGAILILQVRPRFRRHRLVLQTQHWFCGQIPVRANPGLLQDYYFPSDIRLAGQISITLLVRSLRATSSVMSEPMLTHFSHNTL